MKARRITLTILSVLMVFSMIFGSAMAEDGQLFRRNVSKTPEHQTDQAGIYMMDFYVPAQKSTGEVYTDELAYVLADETDAADYAGRMFAKPLVTIYDDGISEHQFISDETTPISIDGGVIFGAFDGYAGVSLDDGTTWKTTNLSQSSDLSSFNLKDGTAYPGHVHKIVHQVFGDQIFVAWISKYCEGGSPLYSLTTENQEIDYTEYLKDLEETYGKDALYLYDLFGVAGTQSSVDYTDQGWPEVGEIPYSCVWTARGKLLAGDDPATTDVAEATYVMWTKAERLTSGTRDANLPAVDCAIGAGCILTWQEDPEGLRPGTGLGPGEGWSGAVANSQTDIWFSYISDAEFDDVFSAEDVVGAIEIENFALLTDTTMPKAYVPMAIPTRLTDNAMCKGIESDKDPSAPYCYIDFDSIDDIDHTNYTTLYELTSPEADADYCASTINWETPGGTVLPVCVTDDGRVLNGRLAATRVRLNLKPYNPLTASDIDDDGDVDRSAWVIMAAEETKALGDMLIDYLGNEAEDPIDIGKDVWYYSFDMFAHPIVEQGGMLNQPSTCSPWTVGTTVECEPYEFFPVQIDPLNGGEFYLTEIARRFALTSNSSNAILDSESGLSAMLIFKQGIINQGGPADIMLRRVIAPDDFDATIDNPYAFENMECAEWAYTDGLNPNYLKGICLSPAINISGTTIVECDDATGNDACAATFPVADDGSIPDAESDFPKMLEWRQCDGVAAIDGCENTNDLTGDLDDQSWESPFDIAKGHRGFLDGDYVMMMYAWSPNWKSNSVGNDHYNLYVRRSFDGGLTWTTTPATLGGAGVTSIENYCVATSSEDCVGTEFTYAAGAFEQGRNVSQLIGNKITILDPRYSPTGGLKLYPTIRTDWLTNNEIPFGELELPYFDDAVRDPSKFFMIYETGDNTTSAEGEATPLDLFYSRATLYGDVWELDPDYLLVNEDGTVSVEDYRWNWDEHDQEILSGEAGMLANPGGTFMYAVWNQWEEEVIIDEFGHEHENIFNSDMPFRRHLYLPDDSVAESRPVAEIMLASTAVTSADQLTFIGSGLDADDVDGENNIVSYDWYSSIDGFIGNGQILGKAADQLSIGRHVITLVVIDDEGATGSTRTILVVTGAAFHTSMPMMRK